MSGQAIQNVVIVGGGTAGWITASLLSKILGKNINITLIESDKIGIIGVGEATIPPMVNFNHALGIDEKSFIRDTKATIKLGIEFENWMQSPGSYMHAFGSVGKNFPFCDFHHFWLHSQQLGIQSDFWDFSLNYQAAKQHKFAPLQQMEGHLPGLSHAYHFDAGLYAQLLRRYSEKNGVKRVEGIVEQVNTHPADGFIQSIGMANGQIIQGDIFIDCSGMHALLIEKNLHCGFEDWSHWLPCNRAMTLATESQLPITPYTRSIAHQAGWQWRIPLQHRTGNGIVYASEYMSDEHATQVLLDSVEGKPLGEPKIIRFKTGRRRKQWHKNVVSIGLSSGFVEPLESTSIHLIQTAVIRLIKHFPHQQINPQEVASFNSQSQQEMEHVRDFIILHYKLNQRTDSDFWRYCQTMDIPDSLQHKLSLFKQTGKVFCQPNDLFTAVAWQQVMLGQDWIPDDYHPLASSLSKVQTEELLANLKLIIERNVDKLPSHQQFLDSL
ncbi:tryptophan halogenase family protein [Neptunicella sp.]|uniref:tryptophan halogenase family protein n=1 Tax=Neptunicella sp. TaxID=2125986 RepID=UPI003F692E03